MNYFITIILALFFSLTAFAQGKLGGGGYLDPSSYDYVNIDDEDPRSIKEISFIKAISSREKVCRSTGYRYLQDHKKNIFKLYLDLIDLQVTFVPEVLTPNLDSYYICLFTPQVKQKLTEFLEDPDMTSYLSDKYKVPIVRVALFFVFFQSLNHGCYSNACLR